jgi:hypothetical protein
MYLKATNKLFLALDSNIELISMEFVQQWPFLNGYLFIRVYVLFGTLTEYRITMKIYFYNFLSGI